MSLGCPTITSNHVAIMEGVGSASATFDPNDIFQIKQVLEEYLYSDDKLKKLIDLGLLQSQKFSWDKTAKITIEAWEKILADQVQYQWYRSRHPARIYQDLAKVLEKASNSLILNTAASLAQNHQNGLTRQLFLDVSELSQRDSETGVQRVVRSYLKWLIQSPPQAFCVEPVFATREQGYCYARSFTKRFLGHSEKNDFCSGESKYPKLKKYIKKPEKVFFFMEINTIFQHNGPRFGAKFAFLSVGVILGCIMFFNVFFVIIPNGKNITSSALNEIFSMSAFPPSAKTASKEVGRIVIIFLMSFD